MHFEDKLMKGLYAPIFYAVVKSMNFNPQLTLTDQWFGFVAGGNEAVGLRGDVYTGRAHLGFSMLNPLDFEYLDYDSLPMTACVTWCCPGGFKKNSVLWLVALEFSLMVWTMLVLAFVGTLAIDFIFRKLSPTGWMKTSAPI